MKKKSLLIGVMTILMGLGIGNAKVAHADSGATAMYVRSVQNQPSDIMTVDWSATKNPPYTYWAVHNWNPGGEAGGYAGFQQQGSKRTLHFSIWDPIAVRQAIEAEYLSPSSSSSRFGGEGEGMKVETEYNWQPNSWYKMTMRSWQEDGHTKFGQWVRDELTKQWKQIAVLDFPVANVKFNNPYGMFQEDWAGTGYAEREARLKNFYSRTSIGTWNSLNQQRINAQYQERNWNGGANSEYLWVTSGGNTKPSISNGQVFTLNQPSKPNMGNLDFDIINKKYENGKLNISWKLKDQSTPQFKGKIEIYNNSSMTGMPIKIIDNIKSYKDSVNEIAQLTSSNGLYAKVNITDLFDNTVTKTVKLNGNESETTDTEAPTIPQNAKIINITETSAQIQFDPSTDNVGVNKYWVWDNINKKYIGSSTSTTVDLKDLTPNTDYSIILRAFDKANNYSGPCFLKFTTKGESSSSFRFDFKGYSDKQFAKLDLNLANLTSKLVVENIMPHYYFSDSYASILIQDKNGETVFAKDFIGNEINNASTENIPLQEDYYLTVKHREYSNRLFITNEDKNLQLTKDTTNSYQIGKNQLKSVDPGSIPKPSKNPYIGKNFNFTFKGLGDVIFAQLDLDLNAQQAKFDIKANKPHVYFKDSYASIVIKDAEGNSVYEKDFIGDKLNDSLIKNIPLKAGYYITIKHREADDRLLITNTSNNLELTKGSSINYQIKDNGVTEVSANEIPVPDKATYYGSEFSAIFRGYADRTFAEMKMNLTEKEATISTSEGIVHSYFPNTYASILIQNSKKETVYSKNFIGTINYSKNSEVVSIEEGSIITITHLESNNRLQIVNTDNQAQLQKGTSVTYQVVDGGLKKISQ
ncbi:putative mucin/carbohydrate-binding domain-containing protein [Clostridium frigidicarnis]|uniref:Fibronectin type III domain-containing protein n=1 Tax=Clostridium frigidicarnis TaxID=84698 RepID=A0A1I0YWN3_9CLOT|nr:putative mucin/carbohydrate-binding domain-containing protein [Clostridium frigidicarnis]SFB16648.1 Fibronectin type III domain-containing protein [Clostridium frigidicarnis]